MPTGVTLRPVAGASVVGITGVAGMLISSQVNWLKFRHAFGDGAFRAFQNVAHFPGKAVGLRDAADFRVAITRSQKPRQLTVAVKSFVVHLNDEDVIEPGENVFETGRQ